MFMVHQHPDGWIIVRENGVNRYLDTLENFQDDFGLAMPELPEGADERIYEEGKRHAIHNRDGLVAGGERLWQFGETVIANLGNGVTAQQGRQPPLFPATADEMLALPQEERDAKVEWHRSAMKEWQSKEDARLKRIRDHK